MRWQTHLRLVLWIGALIALGGLVVGSHRLGEGHDLTPVWQAVSAFLDGARPYDVDLYVYPPSALLIFAPLGTVDYEAAFTIFLVADAAALIVAALATVRLVDVPWSSPAAPALVLSLAVYAPTVTTLHLGNVNGLILSGECAALLAAARGRWKCCGWILGATLAVKPILLPLALLMVFARQWGALLRALALPTVLSIMALALSHGRDDFFTETVPFLVGGNAEGLRIYNIALAGALRLLGAPEAITVGVRLAVVVLTIVLVRERLKADGDPVGRLVDTAAIVLLGTFLTFSFGWNYYALYLMPLLITSLLGRSAAPALAVLPAAFLIGSPDIFIWRDLSETTKALATIRVTAGLLLLLAGFAVALLRPRWSLSGSA